MRKSAYRLWELLLIILVTINSRSGIGRCQRINDCLRLCS
jgi:hypothetical protein